MEIAGNASLTERGVGRFEVHTPLLDEVVDNLSEIHIYFGIDTESESQPYGEKTAGNQLVYGVFQCGWLVVLFHPDKPVMVGPFGLFVDDGIKDFGLDEPRV